MAKNFLYMFQFVVDDLLITRPNACAPEEYPTCCELTFRSHVYISICDKEFGGCIDTAGKSGKCCLFSLEAPIKKSDLLYLHVFKKKTDKCKFLIGATEVPVYTIFDKVTNDFYAKNRNWDAHLKNRGSEMSLASKTDRDKVVIDNDCFTDPCAARKEELCATYVLHKKLLSLSNLCGGQQTGNIVLVMRLACMGPTIVSQFKFANLDSPPCPKIKAACKTEDNTVICKRYFSSNAEKGCPCEKCEDDNDRYGSKYMSKRTKYDDNAEGCPCPECDAACKEAKIKALRQLKCLVRKYGLPK